MDEQKAMSELMEPQRIRFHIPDEERDDWMPLADYLPKNLETLVPMSVGQCFRFRMGAAVDVEPRRTLREALLIAELRGTASVVVVPNEDIMLILPQPVQVDVTFEGNSVLRTTGLGIAVKAKPKRRKRTPEADHRDDPVAFALANLDANNLKLQPWQERIGKLLDDKARVTVGQRRQGSQGHRAQLLAYAKARAVPGCGACGGGGIIQQQQIADGPVEEFCRCLLVSG